MLIINGNNFDLNKLLKPFAFRIYFMDGLSDVMGGGSNDGGAMDGGGGDGGGGGSSVVTDDTGPGDDGAGDEGGADGQDDGAGDGTEGDQGSDQDRETEGDETDEDEADNLEEDEPSEDDLDKGRKTQDQQRRQAQEKREVDQYNSTARIKGLIKKAPELNDVLKKYPEVSSILHGVFKKEQVYTELFPTIAEARTFREQFPGGITDVNELIAENREVEQLDNAFYVPGPQGNYPGHSQILDNMSKEDPKATEAFLNSIPKQWARLSPESYSKAMRKVVGSTLINRNIPSFVDALISDAKGLDGGDSLTASLTNLKRWVDGFTTEPTETPEQKELATQKADWARQEAERHNTTVTTFQKNFVAQSTQLQRQIVRNHPAIKVVMGAKSIPNAKKAEIVDKVRETVRNVLRNSRPFMNRLMPLYKSQDMQGVLNVQKIAWQHKWLLNRAVRSVLAVETPQLVGAGRNQNVRRTQQNNNNNRTGARPGQRDQQQRRTSTGNGKAFKRDGMWYHPSGERMTSAEVLSGKHLR